MIWIVLDNLSAHRTEEIMKWSKANDVRLQFTPTNASWLNRIECEFTSLKKATLTYVDYASFDEMREAIRDWIYWRNRRKARLLKLKGH